MALGDFAYAARFQHLLVELIQHEVDRLRPRPVYATVDSIDRPARKAGVIFVGTTDPVIVSMGVVQPNTVGQVVRVEGTQGDKYITDVMGTAFVDAV